jgi:hypothetical protein
MWTDPDDYPATSQLSLPKDLDHSCHGKARTAKASNGSAGTVERGKAGANLE